MLKFFFSLVAIIIILYISILSYLYFNQRDFLYHPSKVSSSIDGINLANTEEITLTSKDGVKLEAWYRKPDSSKKMAIILHGNSGNISNRAHLLQELINLGYGFIIPAWRGFGKSEGSPSLSGLYLDAESAIEFLKSQNIKLSDTIIIGESLGTGIATKMATQYKFKGIFLITPYKSIAARADELYPFMMARYLTKDNFSVIDNIDKVNQPVLIIHCTDDDVIPLHHAQEVYAKAKDPKRMVTYQGCNHTNYDANDAFKQMDSFIAKN